MKVNLFSKYEMLVKVNGEEIYVNNCIRSVEIVNNTVLYCYPLGDFDNEVAIPYCVKLNIEESFLTTKSENAQIVNFLNYAEITLHQLKISRPSSSYLVNSFEFSFNNSPHQIEVFSHCQNNFIFKNTNVLFKTTLKDLTDCTIYKLGSFIIVSYFADEQKLLIFDLNKTKIAFDESILQFEIDKNLSTLSVIKKINDSLSHGEVFVFELTNRIETRQNYLIYTNDKTPINKELDEFVFFDCVKAKNYKKARTYLTEELNNLLTNEAMFEYLKDYKEIRLAENENEFYLIPNKSVCKAECYVFEKVNNLINNIKMLDKINKI